MLVAIKRKDFAALDGTALIWVCIEPTILKIRGKDFPAKADVYSQLTSGQRALLMFQILYGHTLRGVEELLFCLSYILSNQSIWSQMINGMKYFGASDMVRFLDVLYTIYERFRDDIEQHRLKFGKTWTDAELSVSLSNLDALLRESVPATISLISSYIHDHAEQFVKFDD